MENGVESSDPHPFYANGGNPVAMSHAGDTSGGAASGSLASYQAAAELGFRWFQVDVVAVGGRELVSSHAITGRRRSWEDRTLRELQTADPTVASLRELIDALPAARWNIEIKSVFAVDALIGILDELPSVENIAISSPFRPSILARLRERYGDELCLNASLLGGGLTGFPLLPGAATGHAVQVFWPLAVSRRVIDRSERRGVHFQVWPVNDTARMARLLDRGAAGIITDEHAELVRILRERGEWSDPA